MSEILICDSNLKERYSVLCLLGACLRTIERDEDFASLCNNRKDWEDWERVEIKILHYDDCRIINLLYTTTINDEYLFLSVSRNPKPFVLSYLGKIYLDSIKGNALLICEHNIKDRLIITRYRITDFPMELSQ